MLALQASEGQWGGDAYYPYWTSTTFTLLDLRDLGVDPASPEVLRAVELVKDKVRFQWTEEDIQPFFKGEIETCINGIVVAFGAYFDEPNTTLVDRLLGEQLDDAGWNCWAGEAWPDEETNRSSFNTTISVLEGLLEYEWAKSPDPTITGARFRAHEYLLERHLFQRLSTGEVVKPTFLQFSFPPRYRYDVPRGLEYLRSAGVAPASRIDEALKLVLGKRDDRDRWPLENPHAGEVHRNGGG